MLTTFTTSIVAAAVAVATSGAQQSNAERPAVDPKAVAAVQKMGAFLREQQSFTVHTNVEHDFVLANGQKVRLKSQGEIRVRRPDHLFAQTRSDRKDRQFFYDGKTFTVFGRKLGYFAVVAAPPTIIQLADRLEDRYGLELPMVDLFRWGTKESDVEDLTGGIYVGAAMVDGVLTDQYAFRQKGLDWQIWIERGARPLPRKLVLTTTDDPARPEHSVEMTWNLGVKHADSEFTFVPPKGAQRIRIAELDGGPPAPAPTNTNAQARREEPATKRESSCKANHTAPRS